MNLKRPSITGPVSICTRVSPLNPGSWHQINYRLAGRVRRMRRPQKNSRNEAKYEAAPAAAQQFAVPSSIDSVPTLQNQRGRAPCSLQLLSVLAMARSRYSQKQTRIVMNDKLSANKKVSWIRWPATARPVALRRGAAIIPEEVSRIDWMCAREKSDDLMKLCKEAFVFNVIFSLTWYVNSENVPIFIYINLEYIKYKLNACLKRSRGESRD